MVSSRNFDLLCSQVQYFTEIWNPSEMFISNLHSCWAFCNQSMYSDASPWAGVLCKKFWFVVLIIGCGLQDHGQNDGFSLEWMHQSDNLDLMQSLLWVWGVRCIVIDGHEKRWGCFLQTSVTGPESSIIILLCGYLPVQNRCWQVGYEAPNQLYLSPLEYKCWCADWCWQYTGAADQARLAVTGAAGGLHQSGHGYVSDWHRRHHRLPDPTVCYHRHQFFPRSVEKITVKIVSVTDTSGDMLCLVSFHCKPRSTLS